MAISRFKKWILMSFLLAIFPFFVLAQAPNEMRLDDWNAANCRVTYKIYGTKLLLQKQPPLAICLFLQKAIILHGAISNNRVGQADFVLHLQ